MAYYCKIIEDSICDIRLTTMELSYPRFILPELNTHRVFSRSTCSHRAIPLTKIIESIKNNPVIPVFWGKNKSGMQADEEINSLDKILAEREWLAARDSAIKHAEFLGARGVHKQVVNRILEPFIFAKTIVTATEWDNFFTLRCDAAAQPEIKVLADLMKAEYLKSVPKQVSMGEWHLPYIKDDERGESIEDLKRMSAARCARVSYLNHDGKIDKQKDFELFERLYSSKHASPMEHQATPLGGYKFETNFRGWSQFRRELEL